MIAKLKFLIKQDLVNNILHTYSSRILLIILGLLNNIILTRYLGVENYGIYTLALIIIALGTQFGNFGLHAVNLFYAAKRKMLLGMLLKNSILFSIVSGTIIGFSIYLLSIIYPKVFDVDPTTLLIIIVMIPISLMSLFTKNLLIGIGNIKLDNKISIYTRILSILLLLLSIYLFDLYVNVALCIFAIGLLVGLFVILNILKKNVIYRYKLSSKLFKKISKFGLKAYISAIFAFLVLKSDLFFVNYYLSKSELGYYSLAVSFIDYVLILPIIIGTILFQKLSSMKNDDEKYNLMKKIRNYFTMFYIIFLLIIYNLSETIIILLYGNVFYSSIIYFQILLIGIFFYALEIIEIQYLITTGNSILIVYYWIISFLVNVLINYIYINSYGLYAVTSSTIISYLLIFLLVRIHIYIKVNHHENKIYNQ